MGEGSRKDESVRGRRDQGRVMSREAMLLVLKMEKGGHEPRNREASKSVKHKEMDSPLEPAERTQFCQCIYLIPVRPIKDF